MRRAAAASDRAPSSRRCCRQPKPTGTRYLAPILRSLVDSLDEAIAHIARYGSQHTDAIVTEHHGNAMRFLREVDSSSVMINASPRLADGFEYGLGAEIGISTNKLHARGPVGLEGLTSRKWIVLGSGQLRTKDRRGVIRSRRLGKYYSRREASGAIRGARREALPVEGRRQLLRYRRRRAVNRDPRGTTPPKKLRARRGAIAF